MTITLAEWLAKRGFEFVPDDDHWLYQEGNGIKHAGSPVITIQIAASVVSASNEVPDIRTSVMARVNQALG